LTRWLTRRLFGDKGDIGKRLPEALLRRGLKLVTRICKNMKALRLSLEDKALLDGRNRAETIISHMKGFSSINLPMHRSWLIGFLRILAATVAYQIDPFRRGTAVTHAIPSKLRPENALLAFLHCSSCFPLPMCADILCESFALLAVKS
jgi:hypothetical protein